MKCKRIEYLDALPALVSCTSLPTLQQLAESGLAEPGIPGSGLACRGGSRTSNWVCTRHLATLQSRAEDNLSQPLLTTIPSWSPGPSVHRTIATGI